MAAPDFKSILAKHGKDIQKLPPPPVGTYICNNPKLPEFKGLGKNSTPVAEFNFIVLQPDDDVDAQQLADFGGMEKLRGRKIRYRGFLTEESEGRTKEELFNAFKMGKNIEDIDDWTWGQIFNATLNKPVRVTIKHIPNDAGDGFYTEVEKLAAA